MPTDERADVAKGTVMGTVWHVDAATRPVREGLRHLAE
jgi:hypothetical protein